MPTPPNRRYTPGPKPARDTSGWTPAEREAARVAAQLKTPVAEMQLTVRVINAFEAYGVILVEDLLAQPYARISQMHNFGDKTLKEVKTAILALGLPVPNWKKPPKARKRKKRTKDAH